MGPLSPQHALPLPLAGSRMPTSLDLKGRLLNEIAEVVVDHIRRMVSIPPRCSTLDRVFRSWTHGLNGIGRRLSPG